MKYIGTFTATFALEFDKDELPNTPDKIYFHLNRYRRFLEKGLLEGVQGTRTVVKGVSQVNPIHWEMRSE